MHPLPNDDKFESYEFVSIPDERILRQTYDAVTPDPLCLIWACRHAKKKGLVLFLVHTHVSQEIPMFSRLDEKTERKMASRVMELTGVDLFGAAVFAAGGYQARLWKRQGHVLVQTDVTIEA